MYTKHINALVPLTRSPSPVPAAQQLRCSSPSASLQLPQQLACSSPAAPLQPISLTPGFQRLRRAPSFPPPLLLQQPLLSNFQCVLLLDYASSTTPIQLRLTLTPILVLILTLTLTLMLPSTSDTDA